MGPRGILYVLAMSVLASGCGVARQATRRLVVDPFLYNRPKNELLTDFRNHTLSKFAWNDFKYSGDYERGFRRGFSDYLEGGSGEPPILPPRRYWKVDYESPAGHLAIADWFTGYRLGAEAAESSGYRHWVTIPTSLTYRSNIATPSWDNSGVSADEMDTVLEVLTVGDKNDIRDGPFLKRLPDHDGAPNTTVGSGVFKDPQDSRLEVLQPYYEN